MTFYVEDDLIPWLMSIHGLGVTNWVEGLSFITHFLLHALITFILLTLPYRKTWVLVLISVSFALFFELIIDWHIADFWNYGMLTPDGRADVTSRVLGALAPLLTLIYWKRNQQELEKSIISDS